MPNEYFFIVEKHAIDSFDGGICRLCGIVVNESVTTRVACLIGGNLARQDGAKSSESIVESLIVDVFVEVLDENITLTSLAQMRVALRPHNAAI
jgi:hypothetical protein